MLWLVADPAADAHTSACLKPHGSSRAVIRKKSAYSLHGQKRGGVARFFRLANKGNALFTLLHCVSRVPIHGLFSTSLFLSARFFECGCVARHRQ